ncbi:hypothetical protein EON77_12840, partial [bacterium]
MADFVDGMTAQCGYAAVGTSDGKMEPLAIPDLGNAVDVDVRLKNRWHLVRAKELPGVFRPLVAPYYEIFEEKGSGVPFASPPGPRKAGSLKIEDMTSPAPEIPSLPKV